VVVATRAERLRIAGVPSRFIRLGERVGAANAGRKAMTLVFAMVLGAACIDDRNVLRSRRLSALLDRRSERRRADAVGDGPETGHARDHEVAVLEEYLWIARVADPARRSREQHVAGS
jgi:hypothetical protein